MPAAAHRAAPIRLRCPAICKHSARGPADTRRMRPPRRRVSDGADVERADYRLLCASLLARRESAVAQVRELTACAVYPKRCTLPRGERAYVALTGAPCRIRATLHVDRCIDCFGLRERHPRRGRRRLRRTDRQGTTAACCIANRPIATTAPMLWRTRRAALQPALHGIRHT
jgi:hypothetical protein